MWHSREISAVLDELKTSRQGLAREEWVRRLTTYGPNELRERKRKAPFMMFLGQFKDLMILVLLGAAAVSMIIGDLTDSIPIAVIVAVNACIGFIQEYRAERAMESLKKMASSTATVSREGAPLTVPSAELVPGDIVILEAGMVVPADMRLMEVAQLKIEEAPLTGDPSFSSSVSSSPPWSSSVSGRRTRRPISARCLSSSGWPGPSSRWPS